MLSLISGGESFGRDDSAEMFAFGQFDNIDNGKTNYRVYELFIFAAMGAAGGVLGIIVILYITIRNNRFPAISFLKILNS